MRGTATATAPALMRRLPRILLSAGIIFGTCFVYYVEFLWWQQQQQPGDPTAGATSSRWAIPRLGGGGRRGSRVRSPALHHRMGGTGNTGSAGIRNKVAVPNAGAVGATVTTSAVEQALSDFVVVADAAAAAGREAWKKRRKQQPEETITIRGAVDNATASAAMLDGVVDHDGFKRHEQEQEQPPEQQDTEEDEAIDEEEELRRGKLLLPNELDEDTMERKRLSQNVSRYALPPIRTVLNANRTVLIGDPQPYLDFAIVGFGKCGTTSAMHLLRSHAQLQSLQSELWALFNGDVPKLINRIHDKLDLALPRGYKCPGDIFSPNSLNLFRDVFPKTKLIIGVRHPVPWFQSLYNFRIQNFDTYDSIPMPNDMIGLCTREMLMCCTQRGHFGHFLMKLGKQQYLWQQGRHPDQQQPHVENENEPSNKYRVVPGTLEHNLSHWYDRFGDKRWAYEKWNANVYENPIPNPVFLFELNQMGDANSTRTQEFQRDLATFLDVSPEGFHPTPERVSPGKIWDDETQMKRNARKINICDDVHRPARNELMAQSRATSLWIRNVFLKSPGVHSSSTNDHLEALFEKWMHDPCDEVKKKAAVATG
jgi:hypothetical protein